MSNDLEYRPSPPPDFGVDDDENKDDDQMFKSARLPATDDIPLSEDEENPFAETIPSTTSINLSTSTPVIQETEVITNNENQSEESISNSVEIQSSITNNENTNGTTTTTTTPIVTKKRMNEPKIEITVSDPTKVGEGMSSYMTYRITTKTSLAFFKQPEFVVNRRFSDFLGLHNKLLQKHLQVGVILPSPPEKDSLVMAKVKISKDENIPTDFIDRRRSQLERYLNRLARHDRLVQDPDFRDFIEMSSDLPKSSSTQALSGANVLRVLSSLSNSVTKLTTKTSEQDQWFDEKQTFIIDLHTNFKQLYNYFNILFTQRKESGQAMKQLATTLNHLATIEEHTLLSSALIELANVEEKLEQVQVEHSCREYALISELIKEYVSLLEMIQLVFQERIKIHQNWLNAEDLLKKKRETKTKLEQTSKNADKLPTIEMEIHDCEGKVERGKEDFERISTTIKQELEVFEQARIEDFQIAIQNYLKLLLEEQEKILEIWEGYLPEANKISV